MDTQDFVNNLTDRKFWYRLVCMVMYGLIFYVIESVVLLLALFQLLYKLFTNEPHEQVRKLCKSLALYINQLVQYLLFNSEYQPFPIGEWPSENSPATTRAGAEPHSRQEPKPEPRSQHESTSEPKPGAKSGL